MTSVQNKRQYEGKSDQEIYEAAVQAIPNAGMQVWKRRDIARLVMGIGEAEGQEVRFNVVVSMVDASATISAEADSLDNSALNSITERLIAEMDKLLA